MAQATPFVEGRRAPPESVAERLRAWGPAPLIYIAVLTMTTVGVVYASNLSRLWLLAVVIAAGAAGMLFFSSKTGWHFHH